MVALPSHFPTVPPNRERPYPSLPDKQGQALRARTHPVPAGLRLPCATLPVWPTGVWRAQGETLRKYGGTSNTPPRTPKPGIGSGLDI